MVEMKGERIQCRSAIRAITNAQQKMPELMTFDTIDDSLGIVSAWFCQSQLMMAVPFSNVLQLISTIQFVIDRLKIMRILVEEGYFVVGIPTWSDGIAHNGDSIFGKKTKQLPSCLNVLIIQDAPTDVIHLATIDDRHRCWTGFVDDVIVCRYHVI